jgi:hypothetical protein
MITQVTSFKTGDGKTFDTLQKAEQHEGEVALDRLLQNCGVGSGGEWDASMFYNFLIENNEEVRRLLFEIAERRDD